MKPTGIQPTRDAEPLAFSPRQGEVLDAALHLLVTKGDSLTMGAVTKAASCSKETLYNWFGDRDGLLTAIIRWQAAKVSMPEVDPGQLDVTGLSNSIEQFGASLLGVLTGKTSVALNRVAIGRAGAEGATLGQTMLHFGRFAMGRRLKPLLEAGRRAGLISFTDAEEAFASFFGLLVRDVQIRLLLGEKSNLSAGQIEQQAGIATKQFMRIFTI